MIVALRGLLLLAFVPAACSLTSLDDLSANADHHDSGTSGDGSTSDCQAGVNCNGCASCDAWCGCVASTLRSVITSVALASAAGAKVPTQMSYCPDCTLPIGMSTTG